MTWETRFWIEATIGISIWGGSLIAFFWLLRRMYLKYLHAPVYNTIDFDTIKSLVCHEFKVDEQTLSSRSNKETASIPRMVFMYLCSKHLKMKATVLAEKLNRDRTTIIHAVKRMQGYIDVNDPLGIKVKTIENQFLNF